MAIYYIDSLYFSAATAVYTDSALNTHAPDGYYSFSGFWRQQNGGILITSATTCVTPPTAFTVHVGDPTCIGGLMGIGPFTTQTIYSLDSPLIMDSLIYSDAAMTTLVTFGFMQMTSQGNPYAEVSSGAVSLYATGSPC